MFSPSGLLNMFNLEGFRGMRNSKQYHKPNYIFLGRYMLTKKNLGYLELSC